MTRARRSGSRASPSGRRRCPAGRSPARRSAAKARRSIRRPSGRRPRSWRRPSAGARPTASPSPSRWRARRCALPGRDPATLPSVFTSAHGDLAVNDYMCATLATQPTAISPTRFHNSVHNAAAGYWTIATGCHAASSAADRVRRELRRRPARSGDASARPTSARCCWSRSTSPAVGALASVTRSVGLLATALVIAPAGASGGTRGPSFAATLVSGPTRAVPLRSAAARALAGNAMADALPFFEALALGAERRARPAAVAHAGAAPGGRRMKPQYDVVIAGGGLAGLTLALQLKQRFADLDDPGARAPAPSGARSGAQGRRVVGRDRRQLLQPGARPEAAPARSASCKKFGFRFFSSEGRRDIEAVTEIGASRYLSVPSYQIDRGIFENFLGEEVQRRGIAFVDGARVQDIALSESGGAAPDRLARRRRAAHDRSPLARRRLRPRRPAEAKARPRGGERPRRQRRLVPHAGPDRDRRLAGRRRPGGRAASRRRAGSRPTTWSAPATGSG